MRTGDPLAGPESEVPLATPAPVVVGGRYRLQQELGRGATGTVYLADDTSCQRLVAVKLIARPPSSASSGDTADPSVREWRAAQRLQHPGIVAILDAGSDGQRHWMVSEYAPGVSLERYVRPARLLPEALVLRIGAQMASALAHAHAQGIVHRDLKPSNVLLDLPTGTARILDFGVARIDDGSNTRTGMTLGTPAYMAPEQLAGAAASRATDIYAMGVMLFELLAGRRPHVAASLGELLRAVGAGEPARLGELRPGLEPPVIGAIEALLHRDPTRRMSDLEAVAVELAALADAVQAAGTDAP